MKRRGIEIISYFQVDNPLINIFDPLFIGLHALDKAEMSSKAVIKGRAVGKSRQLLPRRWQGDRN